MQKALKRLVLVFMLVCTALLILGCQQSKSTKPTPKVETPAKETPTKKEPQKVTGEVAVYYLKTSEKDMYLVRELHKVSHERSLKIAALEELISGNPKTEDAYRIIPPKTQVRGIKVENGLATVDFSTEVLNANVGSGGEGLGILSIVNTLTEFPDIDQVSFTVEGKMDERTKDWWGHIGLYEQPFKRNISNVQEPRIWVTSPMPDSKVTSPLTVTGTAWGVFEATVNLRLVTEDGQKIVEGNTLASAWMDERGTFKTTLEFTKPQTKTGYLEVFWYSPKDGSELDKVRVPVKFED